MLNPAVHFREVVDAARSVVLAGGTPVLRRSRCAVRERSTATRIAIR